MLFDSLLLFIYRYGLYILLIEALAKLIVLLGYKPNRPVYALSNFFRIYNRLDVRDDKREKWDDFLKKNIPLTAAFYITLTIWLMSFFVMSLFSKY